MNNRDCDIVNDLLALYVDDGVSDTSKEYIEGHLQGCESCANNYNMMKADINIGNAGNTMLEKEESYKKTIKKVKRKFNIKAVLIGTLVVIALMISIVVINFNLQGIMTFNSSNSSERTKKMEEINCVLDLNYTESEREFYNKDGIVLTYKVVRQESDNTLIEIKSYDKLNYNEMSYVRPTDFTECVYGEYVKVTGYFSGDGPTYKYGNKMYYTVYGEEVFGLDEIEVCFFGLEMVNIKREGIAIDF